MVLTYKLSAPTNAQNEQYESAWSSAYINSSFQNISYKTWKGFVILLCGIQLYFNSGVMILIFRKYYFGQYTILTASVTE